MTIFSRIATAFGKLLALTDEEEFFEDDREPGLWMAPGDATPGAPEPQRLEALPIVTSLPVEEPPVAQETEDVPPALEEVTPDEPAPMVKFVSAAAQPPAEPEAEPAVEPPLESAAELPNESPAVAAAEELPQAGQPKVVAAAASGDGPDDLLSMFRDAGPTSEYGDLLKDVEVGTAQELLAEARAVRDLLTGGRAATG